MALFVPGLGRAPLAGTEGHRALTAHQMRTDGNWLVPHLYGRPYLRKPPFHYWVVAATEALTGAADEFVWRLPSALAAVLAALTGAWVAARWYGAGASIPAGMAGLALVSLWSQSRSADIDAVHTLAASASACLVLDLALIPGRRLVRGIALAGAFAAAWLTKGPACLPTVLGAVGAAAIAARLGRARFPRAIPAGLVAGLALFGVWAAASWWHMRSKGTPLDVSGLAEAGDRIGFEGLKAAFKAALLPITLTAYGLPVSLCLAAWPVWTRMQGRSGLAARTNATAFAMALAVDLLSGMTNPRYGYPSMPLLAPLAGAVWMHRGAASPRMRRAILAAGVLSSVIVLAGIPVLPHAHAASRMRRSARDAGVALARVLPPGASCSADLVLWTHPEIFHYAGVSARWEDALQASVRTGDVWYVFGRVEWDEAQPALRDRFETIATLPTRAPGTRVTRLRAPIPP